MLMKNVAHEKDISDREINRSDVSLVFRCHYCKVLSRLDKETKNPDAEKIPFAWRTDKYNIEVIEEYSGDPHSHPVIEISSYCPKCNRRESTQYSLSEMFEEMLKIKQALFNHLNNSSGIHNI